MADSNNALKKGKAKTPDKPYADFPLFPHQTGRWAKKVRGKIRFYGRWGKSVAGKVVAVEDVDASAAEAKKEFDRCWPYHKDGLETPGDDEQDFVTIADLANDFMEAKDNRLKNQELSATTFTDYHRICATLVTHFGKNRRIDSLKPADFEGLRKHLSDSCNLVSLKNKVNLARCVFKFAYASRLVDRPVHFGQSFDRPSKTKLQEIRNEADKRMSKMFTHAELMTILAAFSRKKTIISTASPGLHAMVLLGLNAGFGNSDCAKLGRSIVDLESGWIMFPRPKTAVQRRVPLWPETIEALRIAIAQRPDAADTAHEDLCFLTRRGTPFVRTQPSAIHEGQFVTINGVLRQFEKLLSKLNVGQRKGLGFYSLRHVFETVAGGAKDQVATDAIMGHKDISMASNYRHGIEDDRLRAVTNHVRAWLWPDIVANESKVKPAKKAKPK